MAREVYASGALRASGILGHNGTSRAVVLATDHRYFGMHRGTEGFAEILPALIPYCDAFMTSQGILKYECVRQALEENITPIILRASGCVNIASRRKSPADQLLVKAAYKTVAGGDFDQIYKESERDEKISATSRAHLEKMKRLLNEDDTEADERLIMTAEQATKVHSLVKAVAVSVHIGSRYETPTLHELTRMVTQAYERNRQGSSLAVLGVDAVGKELEERSNDADRLAQSVCLIAEHGADFVKTYLPEEGAEKVLSACPVPVGMAGAKMPAGDVDPIRSTLEITARAMDAGYQFIDMGRRIWLDKNPVAAIRSVKALVKGGNSVDDSYKLYLETTRYSETTK